MCVSKSVRVWHIVHMCLSVRASVILRIGICVQVSECFCDKPELR